jgi:formate-dependent nitrite reductase cytochrome c552 subunit
VDTFEHTAHSAAGIVCTACHLSSDSATATELADIVVPDHTFATNGEACVSCHSSDIHQHVINADVARVDAEDLSIMSQRVQDLSRQLENAKQDNRSLQAMSVVSLGFGLGIGGVLGIILVALICRFMKEGSKA